jgi:hypothetical protein
VVGARRGLLDWQLISVPPSPDAVEDVPLKENVIVVEAVVVGVICVDVNTPVSSVITQIDSTVV